MTVNANTVRAAYLRLIEERQATLEAVRAWAGEKHFERAGKTEWLKGFDHARAECLKLLGAKK